MTEFDRGYSFAHKTRLTPSLKRSILKYEKIRGSRWDKGAAQAVRDKGGVRPKRRSSGNSFGIRIPTFRI